MMTDNYPAETHYVRSDLDMTHLQSKDFDAFTRSTLTTTSETRDEEGVQDCSRHSAESGYSYSTAESAFSQSSADFSGTSSKRREDKKKSKEAKKKKKSKDKEKKSKKSKSSSKSVDTEKSLENSKRVLAKMLEDAGFEDDFGFNNDAFEADPFEESLVKWDQEESDGKMALDKDDWVESSSRKSGGSGSKKSESSASRSIASRSIASRSIKSKVSISFDLEGDDNCLEEAKYNRDDELNGADDDEDSVLSEMSGLTGVFTDLRDVDEDEVDEEEEDEPDMEAIMAQLTVDINEQHKNSTPRNFSSQPLQPAAKSCFQTKQQQPPRRLVSTCTTGTVSTMNLMAKKKKKAVKNLQFGDVSLRYYERILVVNPSTIQGPSIGVGWRFQERLTQKLDEYEQERGEPTPSPKLVLNRSQREQLLLDLGYTQAQIASGIRDNLKIRQQRKQTVANLTSASMEERLEGAGKVMKKIFNPFGKK